MISRKLINYNTVYDMPTLVHCFKWLYAHFCKPKSLRAFNKYNAVTVQYIIRNFLSGNVRDIFPAI